MNQPCVCANERNTENKVDRISQSSSHTHLTRTSDSTMISIPDHLTDLSVRDSKHSSTVTQTCDNVVTLSNNMSRKLTISEILDFPTVVDTPSTEENKRGKSEDSTNRIRGSLQRMATHEDTDYQITRGGNSILRDGAFSGVAMRDFRHTVTNEADTEEREKLQPVSDKSLVYIRARGLNNLFLAFLNGELLMSRGARQVFGMQRFWYEEEGCVVTTFQHLESEGYIAVSLATRKVVVAEWPEMIKEDFSSAVLSLNGSSTPEQPLSTLVDSSEFDLACFLFMVETKGQSYLQPLLFKDDSVDYDVTDGQLMIAEGCKWAFNIMSAKKIDEFLDRQCRLFRTAGTAVIVALYIKRGSRN